MLNTGKIIIHFLLILLVWLKHRTIPSPFLKIYTHTKVEKNGVEEGEKENVIQMTIFPNQSLSMPFLLPTKCY